MKGTGQNDFDCNTTEIGDEPYLFLINIVLILAGAQSQPEWDFQERYLELQTCWKVQKLFFSLLSFLSVPQGL